MTDGGTVVGICILLMVAFVIGLSVGALPEGTHHGWPATVTAGTLVVTGKAYVERHSGAAVIVTADGSRVRLTTWDAIERRDDG